MDISRYCYDKGGLGCLDYRDQQDHLLEEYDRKSLEVETTPIDPRLARCHQGLAYSHQQGWIDDHDYQRYKQRGWAPIFNNNNDWSQGVSGFGACY